MSSTSNFINVLQEMFRYRRYLEIGVRDGATFINVKMPHKTAVDPCFVFDTQSHTSPIISYFTETSDDFFSSLPERLLQKPYYKFNLADKFEFDIVYIDGLHTFEQSYKDFLNVIKFTHENSIIIFDDTLPRDPYSAVPDMEKSFFYRKLANIEGKPWQGDVYKTIFALHDYHPDFCYATNITTGFAQTIVWRARQPQKRQKRFNSMLNIMNLSYFDMLDNAAFLVPMEASDIFPIIGTDINVDDYGGRVDYAKIIPHLVTITPK